MIEDTDSNPRAHPQSPAAVHSYLLQWGVLTSYNYRDLTFDNLRAEQLTPLQAYLLRQGMPTLIRGYWDHTFRAGTLYFIFDADRLTFAQAVCACDRILFAKHGYDMWTDEDEQRAEKCRRQKRQQLAKRRAIQAYHADEK